ncbi:hypothetical protein PODOV084v1_p0001 [Vibrio phage 340E47.2]|nr:hypothetical protein PODOV084v1_p0001 [Vibrio phage 340E47.2]QZI91959.1 hypothetical protein PODOV077v1_p0048 [Vibrio phage 5P1a]
MPYSGSGGGGSNLLIAATRSDNNNPAVFTDFAALEAYTATAAGTADAQSINVNNSRLAEEVFAVGTLNASNQVTAVTAAYIRLDGEWVAVAANLVGTPGADGTDGVDGTSLEFTNEANRDSFFQSRPDLLRNGLPINVGMGDDVVTIQIWTGADSPPTYTPSSDSILFIPASLRTSTGSLELGGAHTVSSGNQNVFIRNELSNVTFFPTWQSIGDHSDPATRVVSNRPVSRIYGDLQFEETGGPVRTTGVVSYSVPVTLVRNESVYGIRVMPAETYQGIAEYRITRLPEEVVVYTQRIEADVTPDNEFVLWFSTPVDSFSGTQFRAEIIKIDGTLAQVRPTQADDDPYVEIRFRTFADVDVALLSEVGEDNVQPDWDETDNTSDAFISNKPTIPADTNDFVDTLAATVSGQDLTITLGRTGALADLTQTVTLPGGGTTPPQADHTNYIDVTADALAATVNIATAVSSDDLNPTVTLETFTGNRYIQILQSMAHSEFTSIVIAGINQKGGFTVNDNAITLSGQSYRQYVTTNMITDALSGDVISMIGAV